MLGSRPAALQLGLRANWAQFSLLACLTFLVGLTVGIERVALPPLAASSFGITSLTYTLTFIAAFGLVKAAMNLLAGAWSDRVGRRPLLLAGWLLGLPFPILIILAPDWTWIIAANVFVGLNQALAWTMTVTGKIDLVGPRRRGLAVGINESSGYAGVGIGSYVGGLAAASFGLRPAPYVLALVVLLLGTVITLGLVHETLDWARLEAASVATSAPASPAAARPVARRGLAGAGDLAGAGGSTRAADPAGPSARAVFRYVSWRDRSLAVVCQAGFVEKFADTLVWGFFPLYFTRLGQSALTVGLIAGTYAVTWALLQIPGGALADRLGRKPPIVGGMLIVAGGIASILLVPAALGPWMAAAAVIGLGMALLYPNLISAVGDVARPTWRGAALGAYRLW
ncbi:MAG: MFS transporter, partial [Candidatus Limnocylindrales bacterium]